MEIEEPRRNKNKIIIASSITIVALLLIIGISYAFWQTSKVQEDMNIISSGCFGVTLEGDNPINLIDSFPITTEDGMKTIPYTFTITNVCSETTDYVVNLEALSNTTHESSSIRVALDEESKLYSEYKEADRFLSYSKEARNLTTGTLGKNESVTYNLRIWVDEEVTLEEQNKTFASKIVITTGQEAEEPSITNINVTSTTNSISITYNANGETTCKYGITEGSYDNVVSDVTNTNCNIESLSENITYYYQVCTETGKGSKCEEGNIKTKLLISKVSVGNYISMTPTKTSYTIQSSLTGYTSNQTINPSELNLWRVIKKNSDGTVDVVSEYVSNQSVKFRGGEGYMNLVGGLNRIASQYTNTKYVQSTRHMGYSNQLEFCSSCDVSVCPSDTGYSVDTDLVLGIKKTLIGFSPSGANKSYYLASRLSTGSSFSLRGIDVWGNLNSTELGATGNYMDAAIRPILTLKADVVIISGDGKSASTAYTFE